MKWLEPQSKRMLTQLQSRHIREVPWRCSHIPVTYWKILDSAMFSSLEEEVARFSLMRLNI